MKKIIIMMPRKKGYDQGLIELLKDLFPECEIVSVSLPEENFGPGVNASASGIEKRNETNRKNENNQ